MAKATAKYSGLDQIRPMCIKTVRNYKENVNIEEKTGQVKPEARTEAEIGIKKLYSANYELECSAKVIELQGCVVNYD